MVGELLLILGALALWHFVVDGILAPSHQMVNKIELVNAGRRLEVAKKECAGEFDPKVYYAMRNAIEALVRHLSAYNIWNIATAERRLQTDPAFSREVAARNDLIMGCEHAELKGIRVRLGQTAASALTWNSMGWAIYVVPVAFAAAMYQKTHEAITALLTMTESQIALIDTGRTLRGRV